MKQLILTLFFVAFNQMLTAQTDLYLKIKQLIATTHPEINMNNKLLAFNTWSVDDPESREANQAFEKTYATYEIARLRGGLKGMVVVTFNKENLSSMAVITLQKDGISKELSFKAEEIRAIQKSAVKNMVFDSNGNTVYTDLPATAIYESVHQLITR